jgi:hypothetical protein
MIFVMGITMMRMERSKIKWRIKLSKAFEQENMIDVDGKAPKIHSKFRTLVSMLRVGGSRRANSADSTSSRYILFFLPALTVLREGLEAVVFIGGVSPNPMFPLLFLFLVKNCRPMIYHTGLARPTSVIDPDRRGDGDITRPGDRLCDLQLVRPIESEPLPHDLDDRIDVCWCWFDYQGCLVLQDVHLHPLVSSFPFILGGFSIKPEAYDPSALGVMQQKPVMAQARFQLTGTFGI